MRKGFAPIFAATLAATSCGVNAGHDRGVETTSLSDYVKGQNQYNVAFGCPGRIGAADSIEEVPAVPTSILFDDVEAQFDGTAFFGAFEASGSCPTGETDIFEFLLDDGRKVEGAGGFLLRIVDPQSDEVEVFTGLSDGARAVLSADAVSESAEVIFADDDRMLWVLDVTRKLIADAGLDETETAKLLETGSVRVLAEKAFGDGGESTESVAMLIDAYGS